MAHPPRAHGADPLEPPFPEEGGPGGTVVERLDAIASGEDDLSPTGEHGAPMPLGSGDLQISDEQGPLEDSDLFDEADSVPRARAAGRPPPPPDPMALAHTLPPERRARPQEDDPLLGSPEPIEIEPDGEELEAAPTRIEREEDIRAGQESASAVPRLCIIGGNNRGKEYELKAGDNSIGRGVDNDVVLADIAVSRKHTLVCFENGRFVVRDLGSGNGTLVNGERIDTHLLEDGDQLELGNTLMRFVCPTLPQELAALATVVTQREMLEAQASAPQKAKRPKVKHTAERTPTAGARAGRLSPKTMRLAIFGTVGLMVFLGMMVGVKAYLNSKKKEAIARSTPKPDEVLAQEFQEGITEFNAKNWEAARSHFQKVLALAPAQSHVRQYVEQASAEIIARDALERSRARLAGLDFKGARQELSRVKPGSHYRAEADAVGRKIDEQEVTRLLEAARTLEESGDTPGALEKVKEAQALAPTRGDVKHLYATLSSKKPGKKGGTEPVPKVAPKTVPKVQPKVALKTDPGRRPPPTKKEQPEPPAVKVPPGGAAKAAIALYKKRQWGPAYQAIKEWADTQKGKKQKTAKALAENIRLVGQSWTRGEQARQPAQSMRFFQDALASDAKIEKGPHQKQLKELVVKSARAQATTALARRQYADAYNAVKVAEKFGGKGDPGLQKVVAALQKQAEEIFNRAYTLRTSNVAQARRLWQEVLRMVPPTSSIYQKAYGWLNNSSPTYQDEDED